MELRAVVGHGNSDKRMDMLRMVLRDERFEYDAQDTLTRGTLLHYAVDLRLAPVVKFLLESGRFDVNSQDYRGRSPMHTAMQVQDEEVADMLLRTPGIQVRP